MQRGGSGHPEPRGPKDVDLKLQRAGGRPPGKSLTEPEKIILRGVQPPSLTTITASPAEGHHLAEIYCTIT